MGEGIVIYTTNDYSTVVLTESEIEIPSRYACDHDRRALTF